MTLLGQAALWMALLLAAWGTIAGLWGARSGRVALLIAARHSTGALPAVLGVAVVSLLIALVRHDFSVAYVWAHTTRNLPVGYTVVALYAGAAGWLVSGVLGFSVCGALAQWFAPQRDDRRLGYLAAATSIVALLLLVVLVFGLDPFARLPDVQLEGRGLDPGLQHRAALVEFPLRSVGLAAVSIAFAVTMAGLLAGSLDSRCMSVVRAWGSVAWGALALSMLLGVWRWYTQAGSYDDGAAVWTGHGAMWPWLALTVWLGWAAMGQRGPDRARVLVALIAASFLLALFLTLRLEALGEPTVHRAALGLFATAALATVWLLWVRSPRLSSTDPLRAPPPARAAVRRRRAGLYLAVAGLIGCLATAGGTWFAAQASTWLSPGRSVSLRSPYGATYRFTHLAVSGYPAAQYLVTAATAEVRRDERSGGVLAAEERQYVDVFGRATFPPVTLVAVRHGFGADVTVALEAVLPDTESAFYRFRIAPLASWLWVGGLLLTVGGMLVFWPVRSPPAAGGAASAEPAVLRTRTAPSS